ncbi:MAG: hypothetical protein ACTHNQ_15265 [Microbacterium sp.]|uniref:hypothetical protein n=1 Tax=Microbacterium sp. TaxID=51671 RepID=UPI003F81A8D6
MTLYPARRATLLASRERNDFKTPLSTFTSFEMQLVDLQDSLCHAPCDVILATANWAAVVKI